MSRSYYDVQPRDDGNWELKRRGAERASAVMDTQAGAIDRGVELARNNQDSELVIKGQNGQIRDRRTYGSDPEKSEG